MRLNPGESLSSIETLMPPGDRDQVTTPSGAAFLEFGFGAQPKSGQGNSVAAIPMLRRVPNSGIPSVCDCLALFVHGL